MKRLGLALLVCLGLVFSGAVLAQGDESGDPGAERAAVLRIGTEGTYPPFSYVDESGELVGFDIDVGVEVARRLGMRAEFSLSLFTELIDRLQNDEFDVIIAMMSATEERRAFVDFTDSYVESGNVLVARQDDDRFAELADIAGHRVGVAAGTTFETLARSVDGAEVLLFDDFQAYIEALIAGDVDVIIEDELTALYNIQQRGLPIKITSRAYETQGAAIAVKKGDHELLEALNRILAEMRADGTFTEIYVKWFGAAPRF